MPGTKRRRWPNWILTPIVAVILIVTTVQMLSLFRVRFSLPEPVRQLVDFCEPFRSINSYGLFAVMTTSRPEIIVEGSRDGVTWIPYEFKVKPGDPKRWPRFVAPHQPRLDWQMWFAALGSVQRNPWFISFCVQLLRGSPQVLTLLKTNPFPEAPPRYIRAVVYDYRFTDFAARRKTGQWWRRQWKGLYCPVLSLKGLKQSAEEASP